MAKMLIVSPEFRCSNEILTIVAMLSGMPTPPLRCFCRLAFLTCQHTIVPNVWVRPNNQRKEADAAKQLLSVPDGDHLTLLNVYNEYINSTSCLLFFLQSALLLTYLYFRQARQKLDLDKLPLRPLPRTS